MTRSRSADRPIERLHLLLALTGPVCVAHRHRYACNHLLKFGSRMSRTATEHHFGAGRGTVRYERVDLGRHAFALEGPGVEDPQTRPVGWGHAIDETLAGENLSRPRERGEPGREVDRVAKD